MRKVEKEKERETEWTEVCQADCYLDPRDKRRGSSTKAWTLGKQNEQRKQTKQYAINQKPHSDTTNQKTALNREEIQSLHGLLLILSPYSLMNLFRVRNQESRIGNSHRIFYIIQLI